MDASASARSSMGRASRLASSWSRSTNPELLAKLRGRQGRGDSDPEAQRGRHAHRGCLRAQGGSRVRQGQSDAAPARKNASTMRPPRSMSPSAHSSRPSRASAAPRGVTVALRADDLTTAMHAVRSGGAIAVDVQRYDFFVIFFFFCSFWLSYVLLSATPTNHGR